MKHNYASSFRRTLSAVLLMLVSTWAWAWDFEVDGLLYHINADGGSVTVAGCRQYSGDTVIPSTVVYDGKTHNVTRIGDKSFYECTTLTSVVIPEGVTGIGNKAFLGCTSLTSIVIPEGVTSIGNEAFCSCTSLTSIVIPDGVTSIEFGAFSDCYSLASVVIPSSVTSIGRWAFLGCTSLSSIVIPEGVTGIARSAFLGCTSLSFVDIPSSMTEIGRYAFSDCYSLASVVCRAEEVEFVEDAIFYIDGIKRNATLYVPASAIEAYKTEDPWKNFRTILPLEDYETAIDAPTQDNSTLTAPYYTPSGQRVNVPARGGIYIHKGKKVLY